jgi:hypothetical protein
MEGAGFNGQTKSRADNPDPQWQIGTLPNYYLTLFVFKELAGRFEGLL